MNYTSKNTTTPQNINRLTAIGLPIRKSKFLALVIAGLFFVSGALGQTIITTGNTVNASTITAGNTVQINAGGTLNMDAANTFASITTFNAGTSTISGTFALTVTGNVTIVASNILTLTGLNFLMNVGGSWSNGGTFTAGTSTVNFNSTVPQSIGGTTSPTTFNNLTINNTGVAGSNTVTLGVNISIGALTVSNG